MPSQKTKSQKMASGFTIIEVVLVLAIAGLIFLMVFVALPALQRSQRDTARRNDISRVDTSLVQYQTNHTTYSNNLPNRTGSTPVGWSGEETLPADNESCNEACQFVRDYMNSGSTEKDKDNEFNDPDGTPYSLVITQNWANYAPSSYSQNVERGGKTSTATLEITGEGNNAKGTITGDTAYDAHVVFIVPGGRCENSDVVSSQQRHFAVLYRLEGAGVYCIDDQ